MAKEKSKGYDAKEREPEIYKFWEKEKIYTYTKGDRKKTFSVDTPPPTVSGKIHMGHAYSYSHTDFIVRFKRMRGFNIFYPFGFDDNGLPTERYVEKKRKIKGHQMDRQEFIKICLEEANEAEKLFTDLWKKIGLSVDWSLKYSSIDQRAQKTCQKAFIDLYGMERAYVKEAPSLWCPECRTVLAQVELEDKEFDSFFNDIHFELEGGEKIVIATTRPELIPACVAIMVNPENPATKKLIGKTVTVPIFGQKVKVIADKRVDPEKGTGIVMCCTFGDQTDMEWWKAYNLELKTAISPAGRMTELAGKYSGMKIAEARAAIIDDLKKEGLLIGQKPIKHVVNVHERCGKPIEFLVAKQWFYKVLDRKDDFLAQGNSIKWYPKHMKVRFDNWIKGLQWDWSVSRQRFYGIPIPAWYCKECGHEIVARVEDLPVDPMRDSAPVKKCPECGCTEFVGDKDVFDTWACSSLTPQINGWWIDSSGEKNIMENIYPFSLRPQAHDIITFWAFNTVVQSLYHNNSVPWNDIMISGHALDPNSKKMSKSKGNVVEPGDVLSKYSADAMRFWAAGAKLGDDMPYKEKDLVTGVKFTVKMYNASKFAMIHLEGYKPALPSKISQMDKWALSKLNNLIKLATDEFEAYEYARAKSETEKFFYQVFCDNYLEIVKDRLYNPDKYEAWEVESGKWTLYTMLLNCVKLAAPIMPYITEEIYQTHFRSSAGDVSVHVSAWPAFDKKIVDADAEAIGDAAVKAIAALRQYKSEKQMPLNAPLESATVDSSVDLSSVAVDIASTMKVGTVSLSKVSDADVEIEGVKVKV